MTVRRLVTVVVTAPMLLACGEQPPSTTWAGETQEAAAAAASQTPPAGATQGRPREGSEMAVRAVAEAEPPRGDSDADLWGRWRSRDRNAIVTVVPLSENPRLLGRVSDEISVAGRSVDVVRQRGSQLLWHRFDLGPDRWSVGVLRRGWDRTDATSSVALICAILRA